MKVAVIGLGVEGKAAVKSLLKRGYKVYATDINENIDINPHENLEIDFGFHNFQKIYACAAYVLSPSLWKVKKFNSIRTSGKLLSDLLNPHQDIKTIGVTGTNGKTTTCLMIKEILQKAGYKVLIGGNAGGGFEGYTELILQSSTHSYDFQIIEVCDMTLNFCSDTFNFDLVVITNQGRDHMQVHQSPQNYLNSLKDFIKGKIAVINGYDPQLRDISKITSHTYFFKSYKPKLKVFGRFNRENAAAAAQTAELMGISESNVQNALENFDNTAGRTRIIKLSSSRVIIGKTDNADATSAVLKEGDFQLVIIGTPRKNEYWRYEILDEAIKCNPPIIGLFPGLDDTVEIAKHKLIESGYKGQIIELNGIEDVIKQVKKVYSSPIDIFIGGNGQKKLIEITDQIKSLQSNMIK
jgi:UDP-N-acetylmuramoylalanine--D-glutamate ligase